MPLYDIKNSDTGEEKEVMKSISSMQEFLKENPKWSIVIKTAPSAIDPLKLTATKKDNGFKEVLQQIHRKTPGSALNRTANI